MIRCLNLILSTAVIFSAAFFTQTTFGQSAGNHARIKLPETAAADDSNRATATSPAPLRAGFTNNDAARPAIATGNGQQSIARIRHLNEPQVPAVATPEPSARRLEQRQMPNSQPMSESERLALVTYLQQRSVLERPAQQPAAQVAQQLPNRVSDRMVQHSRTNGNVQNSYGSQQTNFQQPASGPAAQQPRYESAPPFAGHPNGIANSRNNVVTQNQILRMNPSEPATPSPNNRGVARRVPENAWTTPSGAGKPAGTQNLIGNPLDNPIANPRAQQAASQGQPLQSYQMPQNPGQSTSGPGVQRPGVSGNRVATRRQDHAVPLRSTPPRWKQFESQMRQPSQNRSQRYGGSPLNAAPSQNPFARAKFRQDDPFGERPAEQNKQDDDPFGEPANDPFDQPNQEDPFGDPPQQQTPPAQDPNPQGDDPFGQRPAEEPQDPDDPFGQRNEPANDGMNNPVLPENSVPPQLPGDATNRVITPEMQVRPVPDPVNPRANDVRPQGNNPPGNIPPANTGNQRPSNNRRDPNIGRERPSARVPQRPAHEMREPTYSPYQAPPLLTPKPEKPQVGNANAPNYQPGVEVPYYGPDGMPIQPQPYYGQYGQPMPPQGAPLAYEGQPGHLHYGQPENVYQSVAEGAIVGCDEGCGVAAIDPCAYQPQFYLSLFAGQAELDTLSGMDAIGQNLIGFEFDGSNTVGGIALGQLQGYNLRSELEFSYRTFDVDSLAVTGGLPSISERLDGSLDTYSGMLNAYWEFMSFPNEKIKPYAGFGVGFMILDPGFTNVSGQLTKLDCDDSTFAYQYMAGLNYKLHSNTDLFFEWRVVQADRIRIDTDLSGFGSSSDGSGKFDFQSSNVLFGARFKF